MIKQIGLPLCGRLIFLITHMITPNWTPLSPVTITNGMYFLFSKTCVEGPNIRRGAYKKPFTVSDKISIQCSNPYSPIHL